jgi:hypothetical protein
MSGCLSADLTPIQYLARSLRLLVENNLIMDATLNPNNEPQSNSMEAGNGKSELMQFFENQLNDAYWAYKDLLKAIFEAKD